TNPWTWAGEYGPARDHRRLAGRVHGWSGDGAGHPDVRKPTNRQQRSQRLTMNTVRALAMFLAYIAAAPATVRAARVVFAGDPIDASSGQPYEMLPGLPLILPGPDGLLGTADDSVDASVTGDIDMVVRAGWLPATPILPLPTARGGRAVLPVGVAGPNAAG